VPTLNFLKPFPPTLSHPALFSRRAHRILLLNELGKVGIRIHCCRYLTHICKYQNTQIARNRC